MEDTSVYGLVRGGSTPNYSDGDDSKLALNNRGDAIIAAGLPPRTEIVRLGKSWSCAIPTGSAYTNVADMPTTRGELALFNGDSQRSYVIDSIWMLSLTSVTAASGATIIYQ